VKRLLEPAREPRRYGQGDWLAEVAIEVVNENPFRLMMTLGKLCVIPLRFLIGSDSAAGGPIEERGKSTPPCAGPSRHNPVAPSGRWGSATAPIT
jgi:hypothetical protein